MHLRWRCTIRDICRLMVCPHFQTNLCVSQFESKKQSHCFCDVLIQMPCCMTTNKQHVAQRTPSDSQLVAHHIVWQGYGWLARGCMNRTYHHIRDTRRKRSSIDIFLSMTLRWSRTSSGNRHRIFVLLSLRVQVLVLSSWAPSGLWTVNWSFG